MVNIMDDDSMTVDYEGVIEIGNIRAKLIHIIVEGYNRVYRQALEQAVSASQLKAKS